MLARCERCANGVGKASTDRCGGGGRLAAPSGSSPSLPAARRSASRAVRPPKPACRAARAGTGGAAARWCASASAPTSFEAPKPGVPGKVVATRIPGASTAKPEPGTEYTASVVLTCSNPGGAVDAVTDEPIPASLTFRAISPRRSRRSAARRVTRPRLAEHPESGLVDRRRALRGSAASAEFGADLTSSGITPVRLKIDNRTTVPTGSAGERVQLVHPGGRPPPIRWPTERITKLRRQPAEYRAQKAHRPTARSHRRWWSAAFCTFPVSAYRRATLVLSTRKRKRKRASVSSSERRWGGRPSAPHSPQARADARRSSRRCCLWPARRLPQSADPPVRPQGPTAHLWTRPPRRLSDARGDALQGR